MLLIIFRLDKQILWALFGTYVQLFCFPVDDDLVAIDADERNRSRINRQVDIVLGTQGPEGNSLAIAVGQPEGKVIITAEIESLLDRIAGKSGR